MNIKFIFEKVSKITQLIYFKIVKLLYLKWNV